MSIPISVVVCTRNRIESLTRCVQAFASVKTKHKWELIIVDNGSSDGTNEFLSALPTSLNNATVVTTFELRMGSGAARNKGASKAQGDIVAFTDDDCYVLDNYIDSMIAAFEAKPEIGFIAGRILLYDQSDLRSTINESEDYLAFPPKTFIPGGAVQGANMAFRRSTLDRIGGFDINFGAGTSFPSEDIVAAAASIWAGIAGAYDPRPTVYHHHGRKTEREAKELWKSYDMARGAYYAKFILRKDTRTEYLSAWMRTTINGIVKGRRTLERNAARGSAMDRFYAVRHFFIEVCGAVEYLATRSRAHVG